MSHTAVFIVCGRGILVAVILGLTRKLIIYRDADGIFVSLIPPVVALVGCDIVGQALIRSWWECLLASK